MLRRSAVACASARKFAVVLAGCGVKDGSEVHEASSVLIHLDARGIKYECFAPDDKQYHVLNHQAGEPAKGESRNIRVESARIARGPVKDVKDLRGSDYDAVVFPGGFGVMKNLSTYGVDGKDGKIRDDVKAAIKSFVDAKKPIGAACIAPMLLAASLDKPKVTLGSTKGGPQDIAKALGADLVECDPDGAIVDDTLRLVTSPAYMCDVGPATVYKSIGVMIERLDSMTQ